MMDLAHSPGLSSEANVLSHLAQKIGETWGNLERGLHEITESAAGALHVERSSVWLFEAERASIRCSDLYECSRNAHTDGLTLAAAAYPSYFRALFEERALSADEARSDPRTRELNDTYLEPFGITAVLAAPLMRKGQVVGVLCNQHVGAPRTWTDADRSIAASLADFAALALEAYERRVVEEALRAREAHLHAIVDDAYDVIIGMREDGTYSFLSPSASRILGYSVDQLLAEHGWQHIHPDDVGPARELLATALIERRPTMTAFRWLRGDGEWRWLETQGRHCGEHGEIRFVCVARDVTEQRRAEAEARRRERQMAQAQKLEAVGQLAGGIAHDFNNLLTAILGHADMALGTPALDAVACEELRALRLVTQRAAALARQLLSLGARHDVQAEVFDLDREIESLGRMLRRVTGDSIQLALRLHASPGRVCLEPLQFEQLLINLAVNARDAMPEGGTLTIETRRMAFEAASPSAYDAPPPLGSYVCVRVRDEGVGIPEALRSRIFDPFFTTKGPGQGSGLGLAMAYAAVKQAGGTLQVASEVGVGTCFTIMLPEAAHAPTADMNRTALSSQTHHGSERILLVEDEWQVRDLLHRILASHGYQVQVAAAGDEALDIIHHSDRPFDLIVSDIMMAGLSGYELAAQVHKIYPHTPVLFLSGYSVAPAGTDPSVLARAEVLPKPFPPAALLERVRRVLDHDGR